MTKEELAAMLDGRQIYEEVEHEEKTLAHANDLLIVYGGWDDIMELCGAFTDEVSVYDGGAVRFDSKGLLPSWDDLMDDADEAECEDYFNRKPNVKKIEAIWCGGKDGPPWTYKTDLPHATFVIVEDGTPYCRGIVIDMAEAFPEVQG